MENQQEQLNNQPVNPQPNSQLGNSLQPTPDSIPKHIHNGVDAPRLNPKYFLGFTTIQVTDATIAPTYTTQNGTIIFQYDSIGNYLEWVRINNTWQSFETNDRGQIPGTNTNDSASAGNIGEYISSSVSSGSPVALSTGTVTNITTISLTAGDWDVSGIVNFSPSGASASDFKAGIFTTSATFGGDNTWNNLPLVATGLSAVVSENIITTRYSLNTTTTIYLIAQATFTVGSISAYGLLRARRMR